MWLGSGHKTSPVRRGSFGNILKVPSLYWMYDVNGQKCFISVSFWCWYLEMINYSLMVWGISTIFAHIPAWHWAARAESRSIPMSRIFRGGLAPRTHANPLKQTFSQPPIKNLYQKSMEMGTNILSNMAQQWNVSILDQNVNNGMSIILKIMYVPGCWLQARCDGIFW